MATANSIITYARQLAQTDSNGLSDTLGLAFASDALQNFIRALVERNINAAQTVESYTTLPIAGIFAWPSDMWSLKTIEVNFLDSNQNNYLQAENVEISNAQGQPFDWLRKNQSTQFPLFQNNGDTGEIFPTPTIANAQGLKIVYFQTPTEYTATTDTVSYPVTLDYRCLGARVAALYKMSLDEFSSAQMFQGEYEKRLADIIRILAPSSQQPITAEPLHISGFQY